LILYHQLRFLLDHFHLQALKDEVRLIGWDNLLEDIECGTRLADDGTLATSGAGEEMTRFLALALGFEEPFVVTFAIEFEPELLVRLSGIVETGGDRLLPAIIHGCRMAGPGFIRRSGSQVRHLLIKSRNSSSLHLSTWASVLEFGRRRFPLALTNGRGAPVASDDQRNTI
jgi:hypothetical protein